MRIRRQGVPEIAALAGPRLLCLRAGLPSEAARSPHPRLHARALSFVPPCAFVRVLALLARLGDVAGAALGSVKRAAFSSRWVRRDAG